LLSWQADELNKQAKHEAKRNPVRCVCESDLDLTFAGRYKHRGNRKSLPAGGFFKCGSVRLCFCF